MNSTGKKIEQIKCEILCNEFDKLDQKKRRKIKVQAGSRENLKEKGSIFNKTQINYSEIANKNLLNTPYNELSINSKNIEEEETNKTGYNKANFQQNSFNSNEKEKEIESKRINCNIVQNPLFMKKKANSHVNKITLKFPNTRKSFQKEITIG